MGKSENEIIEQVLAGDEGAFAELVSRYSESVFSLVKDLVGSQLDAEEVAQDVFIDAYDHLAGYNAHKGAFSTWIRHIAYNKAVSWLRHVRRRHRIVLTDDAGALEKASLTITEEEENKGQAALIERTSMAISLLPPEEQLLIRLYYQEQLPIKEIAKIVGKRKGAVAIRLHRIRNKIKRILYEGQQ